MRAQARVSPTRAARLPSPLNLLRLRRALHRAGGVFDCVLRAVLYSVFNTAQVVHVSTTGAKHSGTKELTMLEYALADRNAAKGVKKELVHFKMNKNNQSMIIARIK